MKLRWKKYEDDELVQFSAQYENLVLCLGRFRRDVFYYWEIIEDADTVYNSEEIFGDDGLCDLMHDAYYRMADYIVDELGYHKYSYDLKMFSPPAASKDREKNETRVLLRN